MRVIQKPTAKYSTTNKTETVGASINSPTLKLRTKSFEGEKPETKIHSANLKLTSLGFKIVTGSQSSQQKVNLASLKTIDSGEDARQRFRFSNQCSFGEMISSAEESPNHHRDRPFIIEEEAASLQRSSEAAASRVRQASPTRDVHAHHTFKNMISNCYTPEFGQSKTLARSLSPPSHVGLRDYLHRSIRQDSDRNNHMFRSVTELDTNQAQSADRDPNFTSRQPISIESLPSPPQSSAGHPQSNVLMNVRSSPGRYTAKSQSQQTATQSCKPSVPLVERPNPPGNYHVTVLAAIAIVLLIIEIFRNCLYTDQSHCSY